MDQQAQQNRQWGYWWQWVWFAVVTLIAAVVTVVAFANQPELTATPRGVAVALLVVTYVAWDWWWRIRNGRQPWAHSGRRRLAWVVNLALCLGLIAFSHYYASLLWVLGGQTIFLLDLPITPLGVAAIVALIAATQRDRAALAWPQSVDAWGDFAISLITIGSWLAVGLTFRQLLAARFRNERLIAELRASQEQLRQTADQERELALLRERERLARDLHDAVGHALVLATVKLEAAQRLARADQARASEELAAIGQLLRATMDELRQTVASLRGGPGGGQSLATAIADEAREVARDAELRLRLACDEPGPLGAAQQEALWRVAQEALTNVVKHADATEVAVTLARRDGVVALEVSDDGRGLAPDAAPPVGHFGIQGMHERLELVGGRLAIISASGRGMTVRAEVPLAAEEGRR